MIAFLKTGELPAPTAVALPPKADAADLGFVTPSFRRGTMLLRNGKEKHYRLIWEDAAEKDRRRAVPPGDYWVTGYTMTNRDKEGKEWHIAATGRMIAKVTVHAGATQSVRIDDGISVHLKPQLGGKTLRIAASVHGEHHSGLSIYKEGKRIPLDWRLTGAAQGTVAGGTLEYG